MMTYEQVLALTEANAKAIAEPGAGDAELNARVNRVSADVAELSASIRATSGHLKLARLGHLLMCGYTSTRA